jgi:S-DNA-T family DNA segregation ATPase FtsK/SpoIIIE
MKILEASIWSLFGGLGLGGMLDVNMFDLAADPGLRSFVFLFEAIGISGIAYITMTWSKLQVVFKNVGLGVDGVYPLLKTKKKTKHSVIYKYTLPAGLCLSDFDKKKEAIEQYLGRDVDLKYTYKELFIEVYNKNLKTYYEYEPVNIFGKVPLLIGYNKKSELQTCDLATGEPHVLIAGETGSGKSTVLRAIITNLILTAVNVKLHLVDLKNGAEFQVFSKCKNVVSFCRRLSDAERLLQELSLEVDRRYDLFFKNDAKDIEEYNKQYPKKKLDYEVLIIDEFADLQHSKLAMNVLDELGRKARACGVHMILSTQRPDAKVLSGNIKANITNILGLKTLNSTNSSIIIGSTGLEKLRGKGNGLFKRGSGVVEIQAPYLEVKEARELIKHTYLEKEFELPVIEQIENFDCLDHLLC